MKSVSAVGEVSEFIVWRKRGHKFVLVSRPQPSAVVLAKGDDVRGPDVVAVDVLLRHVVVVDL